MWNKTCSQQASYDIANTQNQWLSCCPFWYEKTRMHILIIFYATCRRRRTSLSPQLVSDRWRVEIKIFWGLKVTHFYRRGAKTTFVSTWEHHTSFHLQGLPFMQKQNTEPNIQKILMRWNNFSFWLFEEFSHLNQLSSYRKQFLFNLLYSSPNSYTYYFFWWRN